MKKSNPLYTVLLALSAFSLLTIALIEISGVSRTALFNKYDIGSGGESGDTRKGGMELPPTKILFEETHFSFGKVRNGDKVEHTYRFKNVGDNPLLITKVDANCGCTAPSFTKSPIAPGGSGEIMLRFNSTNRGGFQQKDVTVYSNAQDKLLKLSFDVDVSPDEQQ